MCRRGPQQRWTPRRRDVDRLLHSNAAARQLAFGAHWADLHPACNPHEAVRVSFELAA
jgi:hypothetical protein